MLSARQALCLAISRCYGDVNMCLWTDGSAVLTQSAAQRACQQRDYSFLPRITNSYIQNKMGEFRTEAYYQLYGRHFWIDVKATDNNDFHWIDDSQFRGLFFCGAYMIIIVSCYWVTCKPAVMNLQAIRTCNAGPVDPVALRSCFYIFGPTLWPFTSLGNTAQIIWAPAYLKKNLAMNLDRGEGHRQLSLFSAGGATFRSVTAFHLSCYG